MTLKIDELTANNAKQNIEFKNNVKEMKKPNVEVEARICNLTSKIEELTSNNTKMNLEYLNVETSGTQRRHYEAKDLLQEKIASLATRTVSEMDNIMVSSQKVITEISANATSSTNAIIWKAFESLSDRCESTEALKHW